MWQYDHMSHTTTPETDRFSFVIRWDNHDGTRSYWTGYTRTEADAAIRNAGRPGRIITRDEMNTEIEQRRREIHGW